MNPEIYEAKLHYKSQSVFGNVEGDFAPGDPEAHLPWDTPLIAAFLEDDDLQEITFSSSCIGFVKTLTKQYRKVV